MVEASGSADAVSMAAVVEADAHLVLDGIVCAVDAAGWVELAGRPAVGPVVERQLAAAHLIVVTKGDLAGEAGTRATIAELGRLAPGRQVVTATDGLVDPIVLLGAALRGASLRPGSLAHHHDLTVRTVAVSRPLDRDQLGRWLERGDHGLLRAKGWFTDRAGTHHELQVVGRRWTITGAGGYRPGADPPAGIVVIGDDPDALDRAARHLGGPLSEAPRRQTEVSGTRPADPPSRRGR